MGQAAGSQACRSRWTRGLGVLDYTNYIAVNRTLVRVLGLHTAVVACEIASEARYWLRRGELHDGWFFCTIDNMARMTGLSKSCQADALDRLKGLGVIEVEYKGMPRKRYIRVDAMSLIDLIEQNHESGDEIGPREPQSSTQSPASRQLSRQQVVNSVDINNQIYISGMDGPSGMGEVQVDSSSESNFLVSGGFVPPTVEQVRSFCATNMLDKVDPELFVATYEAQGWVLGNGRPMQSWEGAARKWHINDRNREAGERMARKALQRDFSYLNEGWMTDYGTD